ncbi:hypothetical protein OH783_01750 [Kocuria rhizophila]|uniref:hypothetical protein n=1 Tax=Kocuria rhizophila TaxID=72000 RepID=UPI0038676062|nr:hypothetical protein OH783_01750 [Kocuria rhizophila]WSZ54161.1 hypothetical protein OG926_01750 [Kocuria rhizophila]
MTNDQPRSLQDVAAAAKNRHGGGGRKLSRIAREHDHKITSTTIDSLIAGTYVSRPTKATLEALAYLSGETASTVYELASVPYYEVKIADQLPDGVDELGRDERETVIAVARALLRQTRETHRLQQELDQQATRKDKLMNPDDKAAEVVATMAEVAGITPGPTVEDTIAALPTDMRAPTEQIIRLIREDGEGGATVHQLHPRGDGGAPENAAADDADGASTGQRARAESDIRGEESQDPGEQQ